jgi:hypothetical protein
MRGKRAVSKRCGLCDQKILLYESCKTRSTLRRRPGPRRIRRHRLIIDQPGLKILLLLTQLAAAIQGAQLDAERPGGRTRTRQPRASGIRPCIAQRSDGSDHWTNPRATWVHFRNRPDRVVGCVPRRCPPSARKTTRGRFDSAPELASFTPVHLYARRLKKVKKKIQEISRNPRRDLPVGRCETQTQRRFADRQGRARGEGLGIRD